MGKVTFLLSTIYDFISADTTRHGDTRSEEIHLQALYANECDNEIDHILADMFATELRSVPQSQYDAIQRHVAVIEDCVAIITACDQRDREGVPVTAKDDDDPDDDDPEGEHWKTH
jgi:hypothetical protein